MRVLPRSIAVLALVGIAVAFGVIAASPGGGGTVVGVVGRELAWPRRRAARGSPDRVADDRRALDAVGRAEAREGSIRDRGAGARVVGERDRCAEAGVVEARRARDHRRPRLQLLPRPRRLLRGARPTSGVAARTDARGVGHLSGPRDLPGLRLGHAAPVQGVRAGQRAPARRRRARLRRSRRHDRAARHRRRRLASVPARTCAAGYRPP